MNDEGSGILLRRLPAALTEQAERAGITGADCLFSVRSDLTWDGEPAEVWLIVTATHAVVLRVGAPDGAPVTGPLELAGVAKVRSFQTIGSAFLQFLVDDAYVNVVRHSNARREAFGRARIQLDRLVNGEPLQEESLARPSEVVCESCGPPLPGRGAQCPRCSRRHGVFLRSLALMKPYVVAIALLLGMMVLGVAMGLGQPGAAQRLHRPHQHSGGHPHHEGTARAAAGQADRAERRLLNRQSVGALMSRVLYDVDYFQGFVAQVAQGFLLNLMLVFGVGAMLFVMNWRLALLVLVPIPFVIVGTLFFWKHIYPRYYQVWGVWRERARGRRTCSTLIG